MTKTKKDDEETKQLKNFFNQVCQNKDADPIDAALFKQIRGSDPDQIYLNNKAIIKNILKSQGADRGKLATSKDNSKLESKKAINSDLEAQSSHFNEKIKNNNNS